MAKLRTRIALGAIAAVVTTLQGFANLSRAEAQEGCGLSDVKRYQEILTDDTQEISPAYILEHSLAFLAQCPQRFETREAHLVAGFAAFDEDKPDLAVTHIGRALDMGAVMSTRRWLSYSDALHATDDADAAWAARRRGLQLWRDATREHGLAALKVLNVTGGTITVVTYDAVHPENQIRSLWLAEPDGAGFPAILSISAARQRVAFHKLAAGGGDDTPMFLDLRRCKGKQARGQVESGDRARLDRMGRQLLTAYLRAPDMAAKGELTGCYWPDALFAHTRHDLAVVVD